MDAEERVEEPIEELDDWSDQLDDQEDSGRAKFKYNGKRRRQIEDLMEERRLALELRNAYDEWD